MACITASAVALCVLFSLLFVEDMSVHASSSSATTAGKDEMTLADKVHGLSTSASSYVVEFRTESSYADLFIKPVVRPYGFFMLLTASEDVGCSNCASYETAFSEAAKSYWDAFLAGKDDVVIRDGSDAAVVSSRISTKDKKRSAIHFGIAKYQDAPDVFKLHKLNYAPVLIYFPPNVDGSTGIGIDLMRLDDSRSFKQSESIRAEEVAMFVKYHSGVKFDIYHSPFMRMAIFTGFLIFVALSLKSFLLWFVPFARNAKFLWMAIAIIIYFFSVSGLAYSLIRSPQNFGLDQNRRPVFFHKGREQYGYEGYIMGMLFTSSGMFVILATKYHSSKLVCCCLFHFILLMKMIVNEKRESSLCLVEWCSLWPLSVLLLVCIS